MCPKKKLKNWLCFVFVILRTSVATSSCLGQLYGRIGSLGCYVSLLPSVFIKDLFDEWYMDLFKCIVDFYLLLLG